MPEPRKWDPQTSARANVTSLLQYLNGSVGTIAQNYWINGAANVSQGYWDDISTQGERIRKQYSQDIAALREGRLQNDEAPDVEPGLALGLLRVALFRERPYLNLQRRGGMAPLGRPAPPRPPWTNSTPIPFPTSCILETCT